MSRRDLAGNIGDEPKYKNSWVELNGVSPNNISSTAVTCNAKINGACCGFSKKCNGSLKLIKQEDSEGWYQKYPWICEVCFEFQKGERWHCELCKADICPACATADNANYISDDTSMKNNIREFNRSEALRGMTNKSVERAKVFSVFYFHVTIPAKILSRFKKFGSHLCTIGTIIFPLGSYIYRLFEHQTRRFDGCCYNGKHNFSVFKYHNITEQDMFGVPYDGVSAYLFQNSLQPCRFGPKISMDQCISYNAGTTKVYNPMYKILHPGLIFVFVCYFTAIIYASFSKIESLRNFNYINDCLMTHGIYISKNAKSLVLTLAFILILGTAMAYLLVFSGHSYETSIMQLLLQNNENVVGTFNNSSMMYSHLSYTEVLILISTEVLVFAPVLLRLWKYEKGRYLDFSLKKILLGNKEENNIITKPLFQFDGKFAVSKIREEDLSFGRNILNYKLNPIGTFVTARKIISKSAEEVKLIRADLQFLSLQPSQFIGMKTKSDTSFAGGLRAYKIPQATETIKSFHKQNGRKSCSDALLKCIWGKLVFTLIMLSTLLVFGIFQLMHNGYRQEEHITTLLRKRTSIFDTNEQHSENMQVDIDRYLTVLTVLSAYSIFGMVYSKCVFKHYDIPQKLIPRLIKPSVYTSFCCKCCGWFCMGGLTIWTVLFLPVYFNTFFAPQDVIIHSNNVDGIAVDERLCLSQKPGINPLQQECILQVCDPDDFAQNFLYRTNKIFSTFHKKRCLGGNINTGIVSFVPCEKTLKLEDKEYTWNVDGLENIYVEWYVDQKKPYNIHVKKNNNTSSEKLCLGIGKNRTNSLYISSKLCEENHFLFTSIPIVGNATLMRYCTYLIFLLLIFQRLSFEEHFNIVKEGGVSIDTVKQYQRLQLKSSKYKANYKKDARTLAFRVERVMVVFLLVLFFAMCIFFFAKVKI